MGGRTAVLFAQYVTGTVVSRRNRLRGSSFSVLCTAGQSRHELDVNGDLYVRRCAARRSITEPAEKQEKKAAVNCPNQLKSKSSFGEEGGK